MGNPSTIERLRGLILSAAELQTLTDWPDALVEDYLNILDNLITITNEVNNLIDQTTGVTRVTADYDIQVEDGTIYCDTDGGSFSVFLPEGVSGETHRIISTGSSGNTVTVVPDGAELLNGFNDSEILYDSENLQLQYQSDEGWF